MEKHFICKSRNSTYMEYGWVYVFDPNYGVEFDNKITVEAHCEIERIGKGHGTIAPLEELIKISPEEYEKYVELWEAWSTGETDGSDDELTEYIDNLMEKYGA